MANGMLLLRQLYVVLHPCRALGAVEGRRVAWAGRSAEGGGRGVPADTALLTAAGGRPALARATYMYYMGINISSANIFQCRPEW
eukprot:scaffold41382_cov24-Prasinocladus_malaysianus.AAC.1